MAAPVLDLLTDLATTVAGAATRLVLVRRAAEALRRHAPLVALELGWCEAATLEAETVRAIVVGEADLGLSEGKLRVGGAVARALVEQAPLVVEATRAGLDPPPPGAHFVVVPLLATSSLGYALLGLDGVLTRELATPPALRALGAALLGPHLGCATIARVAEASRRAHVANRALKARLDGLEGTPDLAARSAPMREALARADLVAPHETAVLLTGESGTGKGVLAKRLHARSARAAGPFVAVNCGAIPDGLVDSDLFGHEAGAFTGALKRHVGRFQRARGGTLLLDEVGELPLATQARLLRVLQEGEFEPVGSEKTLRTDVRIVAATHRPLKALVAAGRFREDLYYRLDVFRVAVPPLRERRDDLPELATGFLAEASLRLGLRSLPIAPEAMARLLAHPWPGNVRELENLLERARLLATGDVLDGAALDAAGLGAATDLPARPWDGSPARPWDGQLASVGRPGVGTFKDEVRTLLRRALIEASGRVHGPGGAAARLGLRPTTLQTKLKAAGLVRKDFEPSVIRPPGGA